VPSRIDKSRGRQTQGRYQDDPRYLGSHCWTFPGFLAEECRSPPGYRFGSLLTARFLSASNPAIDGSIRAR
jgi:hypothetical protein